MDERLRTVLNAIKRGEAWTLMRETEAEMAEFRQAWADSEIRPFIQGCIAAVVIWIVNSMLRGPVLFSLAGLMMMCAGCIATIRLLLVRHNKQRENGNGSDQN